MMILAAFFIATASPARADIQPASPGVTAVWANDGGDKVIREERRARNNPNDVRNGVWNGSRIRQFAARNETVSFNLVVEAADRGAKGVSVSFRKLVGPKGFVIESSGASGDGVFDWTRRPIELFFVRYLKIEGLSSFSYEFGRDPHYNVLDERHIPKALQRPFTDNGTGAGVWTDRPFADKQFPEIAVPLELNPTFDIPAAMNQSIWVDVYVPPFAEPGLYRGTLTVSEGGRAVRDVPIELQVRNFALPAVPSSMTMVYLGYQDINQRYLGRATPRPNTDNEKASRLVRDRHFQLAHRHRVSLIDSDLGATSWQQDSPRPEWLPRLDGSLFSPAHGYDGPGAFVGNGVFSIGTYSSWDWKREDAEVSMHARTNAWEKWFQKYFPETERFLYLIDESTDYAQTQKWAQWMKSNPGPGRALKSFATIDLPHAVSDTPDLDLIASWMRVGVRDVWQAAKDALGATPGREFWCYNGKRPASGTFATEDDGIALRELPWGQYKMGVKRWFFWESTYYNDYQFGAGPRNVWQSAQTIGSYSRKDPVLGKVGQNYSNGDGVLFYPGTDTVYSQDSYGVMGPIASLRLKHWRRGIQDVDYLTLAAAKNPEKVRAIVEAMVPKVLWEHGVDDVNDPTYVHSNIGWPTDPEIWEGARAQLADIIEQR